MERFPLHLIRDPTAFTNSNPGELYNNIFAFIVHPVEMHIFQVMYIHLLFILLQRKKVFALQALKALKLQG